MARKRLSWLSVVVIILSVGCQPKEDVCPTSVAVSESSLQMANAEDYLATNVGESGFGGTVFCAYEFLNAELGTKGKMYTWVHCQEYYLRGESLLLGTGISVPVALELRQTNGEYTIIGHRQPRSGTNYGQDVRAIFPCSTWSEIFDPHYVPTLQQTLEMKVEAFYGTDLP